ncbi:uncharacterized protein Z518_06298 [Rhinocladiella mackenziei CBS 650.93]|uniref:Uncharacterized protein n=1 Tax=Rhinocladiella mackenziei CBS 650.93 TaxID=1442369 RepID=A0A0D2IQH3_9EURO|nr:uncharacterized protein Z518_06298 [Rhinocladiella mackenziei CBS 650.93]KIX05426.1 hypothetical protein Z518_06298 [Rhinocladiella mackenziei CBS 650.93]
MGKKSKQSTNPGLPRAPVLYLNDPTTGVPHARYLRDMIPLCVLVFHPGEDLPVTTDSSLTAAEILTADLRAGHFGDSVAIISDNVTDSMANDKIRTATHIRQGAIKHGSNFASVNLYLESGTPPADKDKWGTNHLELCVSNLTVKEVAEKVYRWLFTVLTVQETLHLIPESEMLAIDDKAFPDYEYCAINESRNRPKDAKIQFVALVTSKPVVGPGQRLRWTVADRTGTANFYFRYRGPASQYTWDWVLKLQPGDRKALPRMPMVKVKESKRVRVAKAPFRTVAFVVSSVGVGIRSVGHGVAKLGDIGRLGKSSEWVPEADVVNGKKVDWSAVFEKENQEKMIKIEKARKSVKTKVFNENGEKVWKDDDSIASTTQGDETVEEKVKKFC